MAIERLWAGWRSEYLRDVTDPTRLPGECVMCGLAAAPDDDEAFVVARPGSTVDADAIRDHVRATLARFKVPRAVEFVAELPRNTTGKVLRRDLGTT